MAKRTLTLLLCILSSIVSFLILTNREDGILTDENRKITPFPELKRLTSEEVQSFFQGVERYTLDRVPCRKHFIRLASFFPKQESYDIPFMGKSDWLFLGNKNENCVDYLTGRRQLTEREINVRASLFADIRDIVQKRGMYFGVIIGPNKSSVYPEYLPDTIIPAKERNVARLIEALKERKVNMFDPTPVLHSHKKDGILYWRTDTHWNDYGCYLAIDAAMKHFNLPFLPNADRVEDLGEHYGDLLHIRPDLEATLTLSADDNLTPVWEEQTEIFKSPLSVLVIGDSFSETPTTYFEKVYTNVHRIHYRQIPRKIGEPFQESVGRYIDSLEFRPDIVLWIQVERAFVNFP